MTVKPRLQSLWRNLRSRRRVEASLQAEVRHYLDLLTEAKIATGMRPEEARRAALIEMGGMDQVKEQVREVRVGHMLDTIWQDLRYGARMLVKSPLFTAAAVLTLGLGIGANSAIFSVVNGVLLRALPFDHPDRLVRVCATYGNDLIMVTSFKDLADWQKETHMFEGLAAFGRDRDALAGTTGAEMIDTADVSPGFFELLKVSPILGRTFSDGDKPGHRIGPDYPITGADGVTILGESFWKQQFGSDPSVIGRSLVVDGYPSTVIGVVPDRFGSLVGRPKMWFPWAPNPVERRSSRHLPIISRLKPNVTSEQASNEMGLIASRLRGLYPDDDYRIGATVLSLQQTIVGDVRKMLLILFGVVALVLLIACANVANLVLARAAGRWREIAIRSALG
ncbi:MAG: ABC transporter permease, partial [Blastocatellia bacterium]